MSASNYTLLLLLGTTEDVLSNTTVSVSARIRVGKKRLKCNFFLVFVLETVDVESSSMSCNRGAGGQTARVSIYFDIVTLYHYHCIITGQYQDQRRLRVQGRGEAAE